MSNAKVRHRRRRRVDRWRRAVECAEQRLARAGYVVVDEKNAIRVWGKPPRDSYVIRL